MPDALLAPWILATDLGRLADEDAQVEPAGAGLKHVDVMYRCFVPILSFGPATVEHVRKVTKLPIDVHLMIVEPERHVDAFAKAGADGLSVHVEACRHLQRTLSH